MLTGKRKQQQTEGRKPPYIEDSFSNDGYKIMGGGGENYASPILVSNMILASFPKETEIENFRSSG